LLTAEGGKVLQVVRATDTTRRTTTSATLVDANLSVTITPQTNTSAVILMASVSAAASSTTDPSPFVVFAVTDSSDNIVSGVGALAAGGFNIARESSGSIRELYSVPFIIAYATPATLSAVTFKLRFRSNTTNVTSTTYNDLSTGQMYAIEVSA
jgi:hypothetical protein